ncbi:hypothetical protein MIND_00002800 [Mycena indigotica]|uniref:Uncharacterized protein n=1 Tax=Mycena indigotica TaxID=2126181 RepID=A0A8H6TFP0_9AGAR|nr:uncharacterized protein MIND_00002800 [Mycena indigotica]KAF7314890.1 hypothetical protein MIND_00002800 [Mycena indigotica]
MPSHWTIIIYDDDSPLDREELWHRWQGRLRKFYRRVPLDDPRYTEAKQTGLLTSLDTVIELGTAFCRTHDMHSTEEGIFQALEHMLTDIEGNGVAGPHAIDLQLRIAIDTGNKGQHAEGSQGEAKAEGEQES